MIRDHLIEGVIPPFPYHAGFLVRGEDVTRKQAAEIIFRTADYRLGCNDKGWEESVKSLICDRRSVTYQFQRYNWDEYWPEFVERYGILDLKVLFNYQIMSPHLSGAQGWCGWDRAIGTNSYNLPLQTSVGDVQDDWIMLAEAFPFLKLRSQLLDSPIGNPAPKPLVEFVIDGGKVDVREPDSLLCDPEPPSFGEIAQRTERCCTLSQLRGAVLASDSRKGIVSLIERS